MILTLKHQSHIFRGSIMKTLYIALLIVIFSIGLSAQWQKSNIEPNQYFSVAENENFTYISTDLGLLILERDSSNNFGEIHMVQDTFGLLHIHKNYLLSAVDASLKIFDITMPVDPLILVDTTLNYPVSQFDNFNEYFIIRLLLNDQKYKFHLANLVNEKLVSIYDSDNDVPYLSQYTYHSKFYAPYAFLNFNDDIYDTVRTYRFDFVQGKFIRLYNNTFQVYGDVGIIGAYNDYKNPRLCY